MNTCLTNNQRDRQPNGQINRNIHLIERNIENNTDRYTTTQTDRQLHRYINSHTDRLIDIYIYTDKDIRAD